MREASLKDPKMNDENIRQIQEAVALTDEITTIHLQKISEELELLYKDLEKRIPERNKSELEDLLQNTAYELHEKIKNYYL